MQAVRTQFTLADLDPATLPALHASIARRVPLSGGRYNRKVQQTVAPRLEQLAVLATDAGFDPGRYAGNWELQLGSLGSGNHFIEVTAAVTSVAWRHPIRDRSASVPPSGSRRSRRSASTSRRADWSQPSSRSG